MQIDKGAFLEHLGGPEAAGKLDHEAKADAIEDFLAIQLKTLGASAGRYPTVAEVEERIETRIFRQGAGFLFVSPSGDHVKKLPPMPANPTLADFFNLRFGANTTRNHCLQSATHSGPAPEPFSRAKQSTSSPRTACVRTASAVSPA